MYYGQASKDRLIATRATTLAGQELLYDANTFNFWGAARINREPALMAFYVKRFTPDYRVAFEAWLRVIRHNPGKAPFGPSNMPQYHNPAAAQGKAEDAVASKTFQEGPDARDTGDKYVRSTVFLASILFLTALAQRFRFSAVRHALLGVAAVLLIYALYTLFALPVA